MAANEIREGYKILRCEKVLEGERLKKNDNATR